MTTLRNWIAVVGVMAMAAGTARAEDAETAPEASTEKEAKADAKKPKRGDFDAGGKVRLPSGPDENGQFATFNWVAVDAVGQYNLLDTVVLRGTMPLAIIKPDTDAFGEEPSYIGGVTATLDIKMPKPPYNPMGYKTKARLLLSGAYMREGAMLLSEKDFPLFIGDFQPGYTAGLDMRIKLGSVVDFALAPVWVQQAGTEDSLTAVQIPTSLVLALGDTVKVAADLGVYTGDGVSFGGSSGGRISTGGALTIKIGKIIFHGGAGVANLLGGGLYPTIRDSFYVDVNVKYAK